MSGPTNPPPDDDAWGGSAGEQWREPAAPPPNQPQPPPQAPPQAPHVGHPAPVGAVPVSIPNYLVHSIVATVLCCLPTGVVGIVYASQVNSKLAGGDIAGAKQASDRARLWSLISLAAGAVFWVIYFVIYAIATNNGY
jgi:hypothetical protein